MTICDPYKHPIHRFDQANAAVCPQPNVGFTEIRGAHQFHLLRVQNKQFSKEKGFILPYTEKEV